MKKLKLTIALTLILSFLLSMCMLSTSAEDTNETVTVRIESYYGNIYYKKVTLSLSTDGTLASLLQGLDSIDDDLSIVGIDKGYITEINGITSGKFGGFDGWLYLLNGEDQAEGIADIQLSANDIVVLYYGDAYGEAGMQYPIVDDSKFEQEGILKFTSTDTTYDENSAPIKKVNPVVGAVVSWSYDKNKTAEYTTDENGEIIIPSAQREKGTHSIQINRYTEDGLPTVLRFAPGFTYDVVVETPVTAHIPSTTERIQESHIYNKKMVIAAIALIFFALCVSAVVFIRHKKKN